MKCEALVGSRMNKETLQWHKLREPEPCGNEGIEYEIRAREIPREVNAKQLDKADAQFASGHPLGTIIVKASLCDRHKKKAIREGKELIHVGAARSGILTHIDTN